MKKFLLFILFAAFSLSISASGAVVIDGTATVKMEIKNPIEAEKTAEKENRNRCKNPKSSPKEGRRRKIDRFSALAGNRPGAAQ
jgi:hypothetical protein